MITEKDGVHYYNDVLVSEIVEKMPELDDPNRIYEVYEFENQSDIFDIIECYRAHNIKNGQKIEIKVKEVKEDGDNSIVVFEEFSPMLMAMLIMHAKKCLTAETTNINSLLEVGLGTILEEHIKHVEAQKQALDNG